MSDVAECPDRRTLARLLDAHTEDREASQTERHVLACESCCRVLEGLGADDTLIAAARGATAVEVPLDDAVQSLMRRLKEVALLAASTDETLASQSLSTDDAWGLEQILDPAQGAGELGWFAGHRVLRVLGAGGMGLVFEAEDPQLRRRVALKVVKRALAARVEHRQRFLREARAAAAIDHPHIVTVHQVGEHRGLPFLIMQLLKGESLQDRLSREPVGDKAEGKRQKAEADEPMTDNPNPTSKIENPKSAALPLAECLRIGRETAEALAVAHERGLIHRDIKPGNIWLESPGGWVKLVDFGLAHAVEDEVHLTQTGAILGTPAYMAPEQARGDAAGPRADLFSLGAVLYRLTTGQPPFQGSSTLAVLSALALERPKPPRELNPEIPADFSDLIVRLLAKDPDERFDSAEAVVEAIRAIEAASVERNSFRSGALVSACATERNEFRSTTDAPVRRGPMWPWLVAAAGAAAMLVAGVVVVIRNKEGREVARISVPEGGSVATEDSGVEASELSKRPTDKAIDGGRIPTRSASEERMKAPATVPGANSPDAENSAPRNGDLRPPSTIDRLPISDAPKPFVVVRAGGKDRLEFKRFADAVSTLRNGDELEIYGNGPFTVPAIRLENKGLVIRAAPGYRPVLVAGKSVTDRQAWFEVQGGALNLEGCDFQGGAEGVSFLGGGAPWQWRNCRFWSRAGHFVRPAGPRLAISDSLIWSGGVAIFAASHVELELNNNIVRSLSHGIWLEGMGGVTVELTRNTFLGGPGGLFGTRLAPAPPQGDEPFDIKADGNVFDLRSGIPLLQNPFDAENSGLNAYQKRLRWHGQNNLYCGPKGPEIHAKDEARKIEGLAAWREFWDTEEAGSTETPDVSFGWDSARALPTPEAIAWLRGVVERTKQHEAKDLPELGPDWDLIGPGEAYLRALAARGEPVSPENLRPEATDEGPFVVLRDAKPIAGYVQLQDALNAAKSGDAIEIRTDGPFAGATTSFGGPGRPLALRSAPGYLPVLEGDLVYPGSGELTVEGIHFNRGGITTVARGADSLRLANCSFAANPPRWLFDMASLRDKQRSEIVNCWAPGCVSLGLDTGTSISIRSSVVGSIFLEPVGAGESQLAIERSAIWNPGGGTILNGSLGQLVFQFHPGNGRRTVSFDKTLVESAALLGAELNLLGWKNNHNLYRTGTSNLVERLRAECDSGDDGSIAAPPFDFDPLQWRLLPGSPGYQAGPDGKDLGADVTRIGTVAPAAAKVAAALRDGSASQSPDGRPTSPPRSVGATEFPPSDSAIPTLADERAVAEWVYKTGGTVNNVNNPEPLPCPLLSAAFNGCPALTDDSLARFRHCFRLENLALNATRITDAGLEHLASLSTLRDLSLSGTIVSDAGLKHLAALTRLNSLDLNRTLVSDAGLLAHVNALARLTSLSLADTQITDAGLPALAALSRLDTLDLQRTAVTDAGLEHLKPLAGLLRLPLNGTQVTDEAIAALQTALCDCWVVGSDGRVHPPLPSDDDRTAAQRLLEIGCGVAVVGGAAGEGRWLNGAADLPPGPFRVNNVSAGPPLFGDDGMEMLSRLRQLRVAHVENTGVTAAGFERLRGLPKLEELHIIANLNAAALTSLSDMTRLRQLRLNWTLMTDADLRQLRKLTDLEEFFVYGARVTDAGLEQLEPLSELRLLDLGGTHVTGAGMRHLVAFKHLWYLRLEGTRVNDAGLAHLAKIDALESLNLTGLPISAAGLRHLRDLPRLQELLLRDTKLTDADLEQIEPMSELRALDLGNNTLVTGLGMRHVAALERLTSLSLLGTRVDDAGLAHLARIGGLESLDLTQTPVSAEGLRHLQALPRLRYLTLSNVPNCGQAELAAVAGVASLEQLSVSGPEITDAGLAALGAHKRLRAVFLYDTAVTDAGLAALAAALPDCQVTR
jgi:serine/threonine protein kinase